MKKLSLLPLLLVSLVQADTRTSSCEDPHVVNGNTVLCRIFTCDRETNICTQYRKKTKLKLYQIAAPSLRQAYGLEAKTFLANYLKVKNNLVAVLHEKYIWGNHLASLETHIESSAPPPIAGVTPTEPVMSWGIEDINLIMIRAGYARYVPSTQENPKYQQAEEEARQKKMGLWEKLVPKTP